MCMMLVAGRSKERELTPGQANKECPKCAPISTLNLQYFYSSQSTNSCFVAPPGVVMQQASALTIFCANLVRASRDALFAQIYVRTYLDLHFLKQDKAFVYIRTYI